MKRSADNELEVVAVRVKPQAEHRFRLLAEATGHNQSSFLQAAGNAHRDAIESARFWLSEGIVKLPTGMAHDDHAKPNECCKDFTRPSRDFPKPAGQLAWFPWS